LQKAAKQLRQQVMWMYCCLIKQDDHRSVTGKRLTFYSVDGITENEFIRLSALGSLSDDTPEGKSIVELHYKKV
jgi:hypothetical protein